MERKKDLNREHRNFPMVPRVMFGKGSFAQLGDVLMEHRRNSDAPMIFLVDDVFESTDLVGALPLIFEDQVILISAAEEPKTAQIDAIVGQLRKTCASAPSGIIGIGGGTLMDIAKAVAIMLNNEGSADKYQGWDLVRHKAVFHVGIPTLSGTGAEVSRTTVLLGPEKKLGINSDYTPFDQVILDPDLTRGVSREQWFYTGMDCYIHCIESLNGHYINAFSESYGRIALELCMQVFLEDIPQEESREKLMMASWHGGMSIAYSQVGIAHAMSYGLSYVLGTPHGLGNCVVFQQLEEYYPEGVKHFKRMLEKHQIVLPSKLCANLSEAQWNDLIRVALGMEPLWENALGSQWKTVMTASRLRKLYEKI